MNLLYYKRGKDAAEAAARAIVADIEGEVNLFLSGGSSFEVFVDVDELLDAAHKQQINLYQVDERYGPVGHTDCNWNLLKQIDASTYKSAHPVLTGEDASETAARYSHKVDQTLHSGAFNIAILGVGEDGHVAGVKPMAKSQFDDIFTTNSVVEYQWEDFHRITTTLDTLKQFDHLLIDADGHSKQKVMDRLDVGKSTYESPIHGLLECDNISVFYAEEG